MAIGEIESRAAKAYISKRDEVASSLRDVATALQHLANKKHDEVAGFIRESQRRQAEIRRMLR